MLTDLVFYFGLSLLFTHEMDAVKRREWKMFAFLSKVDNEKGYLIFCCMHIPLFLFIFWGLLSADDSFKNVLMFVLDMFFILHLVLHLAFRKHWNNEFKNVFSWLIIIGLSLAGFLHLLLYKAVI